MKTFKSYLTEAKVSIAKLSAGMKVNVIHTGRSARSYGIKDQNVYGGKVEVLGIGIIPFKQEAKPNMVLAKDMKELKKKYEKVFKSEEIQYGSFFNARNRLQAAFSKIAEDDKRVKPGFGAYIWKVIDGENKGHVSYCYIGTGRNDEWEVRFLNKSTEFILET
tara:strand:- start:196 stop:684 length:489 start_codon:yes stop_codon:yes gene_type:complete